MKTKISIALLIEHRALPDGSWPTLEELREAVIASLRGVALPTIPEVTIVDAAPSKQHLQPLLEN